MMVLWVVVGLWLVLAVLTGAVLAAMCASGKQEDVARGSDAYLFGGLRQL